LSAKVEIAMQPPDDESRNHFNSFFVGTSTSHKLVYIYSILIRTNYNHDEIKHKIRILTQSTFLSSEIIASHLLP
jgi:hypothetical protein